MDFYDRNGFVLTDTDNMPSYYYNNARNITTYVLDIPPTDNKYRRVMFCLAKEKSPFIIIPIFYILFLQTTSRAHQIDLADTFLADIYRT